jgi:hypothetical protein
MWITFLALYVPKKTKCHLTYLNYINMNIKALNDHKKRAYFLGFSFFRFF